MCSTAWYWSSTESLIAAAFIILISFTIIITVTKTGLLAFPRPASVLLWFLLETGVHVEHLLSQCYLAIKKSVLCLFLAVLFYFFLKRVLFLLSHRSDWNRCEGARPRLWGTASDVTVGCHLWNIFLSHGGESARAGRGEGRCTRGGQPRGDGSCWPFCSLTAFSSCHPCFV